MEVTLLAHTPDPVGVVARAAAMCRRSTPSEELVARVVAAGHESVLEHVSFTFRVRGISRACLAQLTRHRLASFSVESQRSVTHDGSVVLPSDSPYFKNLSKPIHRAATVLACSAVALSYWVYTYLVRAGVAKEDARLVLPEGATTSLVVTMNARELRHCFRLRLSRSAQWEIRALFEKMLQKVLGVCPELFPEWADYSFSFTDHPVASHPWVPRHWFNTVTDKRSQLAEFVRQVQCSLTSLHDALLKNSYSTESVCETYDDLVQLALVVVEFLSQDQTGRSNIGQNLGSNSKS